MDENKIMFVVQSATCANFQQNKHPLHSKIYIVIFSIRDDQRKIER